MKSAVEGPNCLEICNGDCCSIKIDVPKVLAKEYIKRRFASKEDFIRGDVFSFKLRFDENKAKCFLYDKSIKGCLVHNSGIKPPQCWIYPTNFFSPEGKDLCCKKSDGWKIIDPKKTEEAEKLLRYYIFLCNLEARKELITKNRLSKSLNERSLKNILQNIPPSALAGVKDGWEKMETLSAQGVSLQMKKFCNKYNNKCEIDYLSCESICDKVIEKLLEFLQQNIRLYVITYGPDPEGYYSFIKLAKLKLN